MVIEVSVLRYRNGDGSINYGFHFSDCVGRIERMIASLGSFDDLCAAVRKAMGEWHAPRCKAPANLEICIRDEGDHPSEKRKLTLSQGAMPLHFEPDEKKTLSFVALTATADACA